MKISPTWFLLILAPVMSTIWRISKADNLGQALLQAIPIWVLMVMVVIGIVQYRQRKHELLDSIQNTDLEKGVPVRYCAEDKFKRFWCFYPWESSGILMAKDDSLMIYAADDYRMKLQFNKGDREIKWIGSIVSKGAACWFQIRSSGQNHYFTYNSGITIFYSNELTKTLFNYLRGGHQGSANG